MKSIESQFNARNRLIGTQITSEIAGIDILHILGNENTYMKQCSKGGLMQNPYIPTWLLASYIFFIRWTEIFTFENRNFPILQKIRSENEFCNESKRIQRMLSRYRKIIFQAYKSISRVYRVQK